MSQVSWSVSVKIGGGTVVTAPSADQSAEATDTIELTLEPQDVDIVAQIQPGDADDVHLLLIKSSTYGDDVTYTVGDGNAESAALTLDAPHVYSGGSLAVFGLAPQQLKLANASIDKAANITIFVVRDAT